MGRRALDPEEKKRRRSEYNRKYWLAHREEISVKRKANPSDRTEYMKGWRERNREKWNAYMREYNKRKKAELDEKKKA